jgi:hypothetical protein
MTAERPLRVGGAEVVVCHGPLHRPGRPCADLQRLLPAVDGLLDVRACRQTTWPFQRRHIEVSSTRAGQAIRHRVLSCRIAGGAVPDRPHRDHSAPSPSAPARPFCPHLESGREAVDRPFQVFGPVPTQALQVGVAKPVARDGPVERRCRTPLTIPLDLVQYRGVHSLPREVRRWARQ